MLILSMLERITTPCQGAGANLFRFHQDLIRLRLPCPALRSHNIDIIHTHNANRMLPSGAGRNEELIDRSQPKQFIFS
jgi:1,4-alpha-glucan branching enzyme